MTVNEALGSLEGKKVCMRFEFISTHSRTHAHAALMLGGLGVSFQSSPPSLLMPDPKLTQFVTPPALCAHAPLHNSSCTLGTATTWCTLGCALRQPFRLSLCARAQRALSQIHSPSRTPRRRASPRSRSITTPWTLSRERMSYTRTCGPPWARRRRPI